MIENYTIEVNGTLWRIREAKTMEDAMNAINSSRCSGSIGTIQIHDKTYCGGEREVLADVIQVNEDGTERVPYYHLYK